MSLNKALFITALIAPHKATMQKPKLPGFKTSQPSLSPKQPIPHISSYKEAPLAPYNITVNNRDTLEISSIIGNKTYSGKLLCSDGNIITGTFVEDSGVYSPQGTASRQIIQTGTEEIGMFKWHSNLLLLDVGIVRHPNGVLDIGPRLNRDLDGDVCIRIWPGGGMIIGEFRKNVPVGTPLVFDKDFTTFNPYDSHQLLPQDYLDVLPLETRKFEGAILKGLFIGDHMIYGKKTMDNGEIHEGFFDSNGNLHGLGRRIFSNLIREYGLYKAGNFESGRVDYPNGQYEIGGRKNTRIDGENCTQHHPNGDTFFGTFKEGERINTHQVEWAPLSQSPLPPFDYKVTVDETGLQTVEINGKAIKQGQTPLISVNNPTFKECNDVLIEHKAAISFEPKKMELYLKVLEKSDELATKGFSRLLKKISKLSDDESFMGALSSLGIIELNPSTIVHSSKTPEESRITESTLDTQKLNYYLAGKLIHQYGKKGCKLICILNFKHMMEQAEHTLTGSTMFSRRELFITIFKEDKKIDRTAISNNIFDPLFSAFSEEMNQIISKDLPHIEFVPMMSYYLHRPGYESPKLTFDSYLYIANKDQGALLFDAFYTGQQASTRQILDNNNAHYLGVAFGYSSMVSGKFVSSDPQQPLYKNRFYRFPEKALKGSVAHWHHCSQVYFLLASSKNQPFTAQGIIQDSHGNLITLTDISPKGFWGQVKHPNGDQFVGKVTYDVEDDAFYSKEFGTHTQPNGKVTIGAPASEANLQTNTVFRIATFLDGAIEIGPRTGHPITKGIRLEFDEKNGKISTILIMLDGKKWVPAYEELIQSILTPNFIDQLDSLPKDKKIINGITYEGTFIGNYMIYGKKTYEDGRTKSGFFDKEHRLKTKLSPLKVTQRAIDFDGAGQIVQG